MQFYIIFSESSGFRGKVDNNWLLRGFFSAQLNSIFQGKLDVTISQAYGECWMREDLCFGYFGLTPSILRAPLIPFFGYKGFTSSMTFIACTLGIIASVLIVNQAWSMFIRSEMLTQKDNQSWRLIYIGALLATGPGNILFQASFPSGYWEAIGWGSTFTLFGIFFILRWLEKQKNSDLVCALLVFILAANARQGGAITALIIGAMMYFYLNKNSSREHSTLTKNLILMISLLPGLTSALILWLKFGTFFPKLDLHIAVPESAMWKEIWALNGGKGFGLEFFPSNLLAYFRPDALAYNNWQASFLRPTIFPFDYVWPLRSGSMHVSEASASVTSLIPVFLIFVLAVFILGSRPIVESGKEARIKIFSKLIVPANLFVLGTFGSAFLTLGWVGNSNRYLVDFAPGIVLSIALGSIAVFKAVSGSLQFQKITGWILISIASVGAFNNVSIALYQAKMWGG
jgi:hypothetical protein